MDLVWRDASTHQVHVAGSTNTAFAPWASWGSWSEYTEIKFADVNGDGIDDLVGRYPGRNTIRVNLSNGSSFRWGGAWDAWNFSEPWHLADVTGDGKADIISRDPAANALMVGVSTGTGFQAPVEWTKWWGQGELKFGDFNGDGRADVVSRPWGGGTIAVGLATQSLASGISYDGNAGYWANGEPWHLADVNGDGHDDFISRVPSENSIKVMTVEGTKFTAPMEWTKWYGSMDIKVGDVNGDGRADIVGRGGGQTRVGLARVSVGSGITYGGAWETGPDRSEPWYLAEVRKPVRSASGDVDGNGVANATITSTATGRTYWQTDSGPNSDSFLGDGYAFGSPTDYPLLGDFDGNGYQQLGVYRAGTPSGSWYYSMDRAPISSDYLGAGLDLGQPGDIPLVGDFDGNDFDQIAVFRQGYFYFRKDVGPGSAGDDLIAYGFRVGANNEPINGIPLVGDFDDNGHDNFAVFDRSTGIVHWKDDWGPGGNGATHTINTGAALNDGDPGNDLDVPLVGDMDGNGTANLVMYRPTAGAFYWQRDGGTAAPGYEHSWWTIVGFDAEHWYNYIPLLQDFDGNRRDNAAVYRRYNGKFLWKGDWGPGSVDGEKYLASAENADVPTASNWAARQVVLNQSSWRYGGVNGVVDTPDDAARTVEAIRAIPEGNNPAYQDLSSADREYVRVWADASWSASRTYGGFNWRIDLPGEINALTAAMDNGDAALRASLWNSLHPGDRQTLPFLYPPDRYYETEATESAPSDYENPFTNTSPTTGHGAAAPWCNSSRPSGSTIPIYVGYSKGSSKRKVFKIWGTDSRDGGGGFAAYTVQEVAHNYDCSNGHSRMYFALLHNTTALTKQHVLFSEWMTRVNGQTKPRVLAQELPNQENKMQVNEVSPLPYMEMFPVAGQSGTSTAVGLMKSARLTLSPADGTFGAFKHDLVADQVYVRRVNP